MRDPDARLARRRLHARHGILDRVDAVAHVIHLAAARKLAPDRAGDDVGVPLPHMDFNRPAIARRRQDQAHIAHARQGHLHGARNRRRRQRQDIDRLAQVLHLLLVAHAEALLLVDDHQPQVIGVHIAREKSMRADEHRHAAVGEPRQRPRLLSRRAKAREHLDRHAEGREAVVEVREMLLRKNGRRAEDHDLLAILCRLEGRTQGDLRLPETDIATDEAVHRARALHVRLHIGDGRELVGRLLVGERLLHLALRCGVRAEAEALRRRTARVHVDQIERELFGRLARLRRRARPIRRIQPGETRACPLGTHVARHAVELLDWHEQLIAFRILQKQIVARRAVDLAPHEIFEEGDAVGSVDDVVARLIGESHLRDVGPPARAGRRLGALGVGERHDRELRLREYHSQGDVDVDNIHH